MAALIDITEAHVMAAVRAMLLDILPDGIEVVRGQINRVPQPNGQAFVVFWPLRRTRFATNIDSDTDIVLEAEIVAGVMDVTTLAGGTLRVGQSVVGTAISLDTVIVEQLSGTPGGIGSYQTEPVQDAPLGPLYAGLHSMTQHTEIVFQVDVHGIGSAENAQVISTIMRDWWGCHALHGTGVQPLYAEEPKQIPFQTGEIQYEERYVVEVAVQANPTVAMLQEFAQEVILDITLTETLP